MQEVKKKVIYCEHFTLILSCISWWCSARCPRGACCLLRLHPSLPHSSARSSPTSSRRRGRTSSVCRTPGVCLCLLHHRHRRRADRWHHRRRTFLSPLPDSYLSCSCCPGARDARRKQFVRRCDIFFSIRKFNFHSRSRMLKRGFHQAKSKYYVEYMFIKIYLLIVDAGSINGSGVVRKYSKISRKISRKYQGKHQEKYQENVKKSIKKSIKKFSRKFRGKSWDPLSTPIRARHSNEERKLEARRQLEGWGSIITAEKCLQPVTSDGPWHFLLEHSILFFGVGPFHTL